MLSRTTSAMASFVLALLPASAVCQSARPEPAVKWSGYLQGRQTYQDNIGLSSSINRARLTASGAVAGDVTWRAQGEFRTGSVGTGRASVSLADAYLRYVRGSLGVQLGQFKTPFTREYLTSLTEVETADRATVVDSLAPKRDLGLMVDYAAGGRATLQLGIFNGQGQNVTANSDSALLGVARLSVRPLPYVSVGIDAARYFADSSRYGVDVNVEVPWIVLRAEFVGQHRDSGGDDDRGWFALAAAPVRPWLQPVLKYEYFDRPATADQAQRNRAWTAGANIYPWGRATRLTLEYVSREVARAASKGLGLAQVQVVF